MTKEEILHTELNLYTRQEPNLFQHMDGDFIEVTDNVYDAINKYADQQTQSLTTLLSEKEDRVNELQEALRKIEFACVGNYLSSEIRSIASAALKQK